jgi:periplasmic protein CpxP/Spy
MNKLHRNLLTAAVLAAAGLAAVAQTQMPPAPPAGAGAPRMMQGERGMDPARMQRFREERMQRRLGELKQILQITPQQEGAWTSWTTALRPAQFQRPSRVEFARMTTPERIDRMKALRAQRSAEMDKRLDATKTFYAGLSAEQKRLFDAQGMRFVRGGKGGRDGGGRDGGHFGGRHHRG